MTSHFSKLFSNNFLNDFIKYIINLDLSVNLIKVRYFILINFKKFNIF